MAQHHGQMDEGRIAALIELHIGAAHAHIVDFDYQLVGAGGGDRTVLDADIAFAVKSRDFHNLLRSFTVV